MNFDLSDLILLDAIEQSGSFSAAAENLYRTRSAITQHVKKLEDQLGFSLFYRTSYRPQLTPEGRHFLEKGRLLLRSYERLKSEIQHLKHGWESEFCLAMDDIIPVENLFFLIEEFQKVAPFVTLRILREVLNGTWDALIENRATLVIGASGEPPLDLICNQKPLGMVEFAFAVAKGHPLTQLPQPLRMEDLEAFPQVIISDTSQSLPKRSSGQPLRHLKMIVPTMEEKVRAQVQGLGVGNLPRLRIQKLLEEGSLVELQIAGQTQRKVHLKIVWNAHSQSPALAWFLNVLDSKDVLNRILRSSS